MRINPALLNVMEPPIGAAYAWIEGRSFPSSKPLIDVSQAVPGYPPADALNAHLADLLIKDPMLARYAPAQGLPELRGALSRDIGLRYGKEPGTDHLVITAGCNQAFCLAASVIAAPGDEIIVPLPFYFDHDMWLRAQNIHPIYLPFDAAHAGHLSIEEVKKKITARTRAIILVTPNNPTGIVYPPEMLHAFFDLARERGLYLILDETYRDFIDQRPHDLFLRDGWQDHLIHLYSFSKVFALTGYRAGAIACAPFLVRQIVKLMDCVAVCAPRIAQQAALYGLQHLTAWRAEKSSLMAARLDVLCQGFSRNDLPFELISAGAYFAYIRHSFAGRSAEEVAKALLEQGHILALPGSMFGPGQEAFLRLAFANIDQEVIPEMISRLASFSL